MVAYAVLIVVVNSTYTNTVSLDISRCHQFLPCMSLKGRFIVSGRFLAMSLWGVFGLQGSSAHDEVDDLRLSHRIHALTLAVYYS